MAGGLGSCSKLPIRRYSSSPGASCTRRKTCRQGGGGRGSAGRQAGSGTGSRRGSAVAGGWCSLLHRWCAEKSCERAGVPAARASAVHASCVQGLPATELAPSPTHLPGATVRVAQRSHDRVHGHALVQQAEVVGWGGAGRERGRWMARSSKPHSLHRIIDRQCSAARLPAARGTNRSHLPLHVKPHQRCRCPQNPCAPAAREWTSHRQLWWVVSSGQQPSVSHAGSAPSHSW